MAYHGSQQRVEGDPIEVLHRAGEVQQRELVTEIAAGPAPVAAAARDRPL